MEHIAIMNKSWKLIDKILFGEKTIESRWYKSRIAPWNIINKEDVVYFKDAGEPVTAKARVSRVLQFDNLDEDKIKEIILEYGEKICFSGSKESFLEWTRGKKYCILVFLEKPEKVTPFNVDKKGFGNACAWMTMKKVKKIKI